MRKLLTIATTAGLLIGILGAPVAARSERYNEWTEKVVLEETVAPGTTFRITARYDAAQKGECSLRAPATIEEAGRPCVVERNFKDPRWVADQGSEATLELAIIHKTGGSDARTVSVVVPFAGQFVP